jgi:probable phosphoglycerate mutase
VEIVLVRHGQPAWEPGGRAVDDPELTPLGRQQAARVAERLAAEGDPFDALYVSPLRRARETAEPIAARLGVEPSVVSWLRELGLPKMAGKTTEEVERFFRAARERELEKWWDGPPGGESFRHFHERVSSGVEGLLQGDHRMRIHEDSGHRIWRLPEVQSEVRGEVQGRRERILLVAHEGTNAVVISHLLGIEPVPWEWVRFSSVWCGVSRLRAVPIATGAVWVLEAFNRVGHLEGLELGG